MHENTTLIGIETHIRIILDVIGRITLLIESENRRILKDGNADAIVANRALHLRKLQMYRKFETLARIITLIARDGALRDKKLAASMIAPIRHLQHAVTVNNALLKSHIERQQRLLTAIMLGIEGNTPRLSLVTERESCL